MNPELLNPAPSAGTVLAQNSRPDPAGLFSRAGAGRFTASLRVPVRKANREYLRALRIAELAAWEKAGRTVPREKATAPATRLGLVPDDVRSGRWEVAQ